MTFNNSNNEVAILQFPGHSGTLAVTEDIPTVNNYEIEIRQGNVTKGSFTLNQDHSSIVDLADTGTSYTAGNGIDITNDVISVDDTVALKTDLPKNYVPFTTVGDKPYVDIGNSYGPGAERGFTSMNMLTSIYNTYTLPGDKSGIIALTSDIPTIPALAPVATSGSYNDLIDKPAIPTNYVTFDTAQTITGAKTFEGGLTCSELDGTYTMELMGTGVFTCFDSNENKYIDFILPANNKTGNQYILATTDDIPTLPTLATVATTGSYNDLTDKPAIPTTATSTSTSTVTPTTTQLVFTYADNTTETITLMTGASVSTSTTTTLS